MRVSSDAAVHVANCLLLSRHLGSCLRRNDGQICHRYHYLAIPYTPSYPRTWVSSDAAVRVANCLLLFNHLGSCLRRNDGVVHRVIHFVVHYFLTELQIIVCHKSAHVGLCSSINASFHARFHFLSCFSLVMALSMSSNSST